MKKLLYILLLLPVIGFSQVYQSMPQYGYGPIRRMQFDSVATLPLGLGDLRQSVGFRNIGQVRFNTSDSSLYVWTGFTWAKQAGGGSGGSQTWQQTLAQGNVATTLPVINRSFISSVLRFVNPANNRQVDILPGTGSDSLRTLTLPNKGGRLALWTPRTQCINDSLFAWDESGVRQFTGTLCVTSQGSAIVRAHNGLEVLGDSSVGIRQGAYGTSSQIYFDSVNAAFSAGWRPRSGDVGFGSVALGVQNTVNDYAGVAFGIQNIVQNYAGVALGVSNTITREAGTAIGSNNIVNSDYGIAIGFGNEINNLPSGNGVSIAIGELNKSLNSGSLALNSQTIADQPNMTSIGSRNDTTGNFANQTLFQIGNSDGITRSSIFTIGRDYMQFKHSTRANGYVLTSDANGVATWQPPSGGGDTTSLSNRINYNDTTRTMTRARTSAGYDIYSNNRTHVANFGAGGGSNATFYGGVNVNGTLSAGGSPVLRQSDSTLYVTTHDYNVGKDSCLSLLDTRATSANNNGLTTKVWARGQAMESITIALNLVSGTHQTTYFDLSAPATLNGVRWFQTVQGNYTANNFNGFAIYRYDAVNDTAYLVAQTANTGTIWQATANTWNTIDFTSPVNVQAGAFRVVAYYSSSAQTTAPALGSFNFVQNAAVFNLPNTGRLSGRLVQTTPANFKTSTLAAQSGQPIIGIY
jgi:hypothetical protein